MEAPLVVEALGNCPVCRPSNPALYRGSERLCAIQIHSLTHLLTRLLTDSWFDVVRMPHSAAPQRSLRSRGVVGPSRRPARRKAGAGRARPPRTPARGRRRTAARARSPLPQLPRNGAKVIQAATPRHFAPCRLDFDTPLSSIANLIPRSPLPSRPHSWLPPTNPSYFTLASLHFISSPLILPSLFPSFAAPPSFPVSPLSSYICL